MAALPQSQATTHAAVLRWWAAKPDGHRAHLGASLIGHPCDRSLWLTFRWAERQQFDGRLRRLFSTGQREEARVAEELRGIGCTVHADDGQGQFRVAACSGHFGGSMDGVVLGVPEAPKTWHVLEVKTFNAKTFKELQSKGVRVAKPMHWAQMQTYMHLADLDRALYYAVCKDSDDLHIERVQHEPAEAQMLVRRAQRVIDADTPPARISADPAWFECKWCHFHPLCHGQRVPEPNCRTCAHATPIADAQWQCGRTSEHRTEAQQRQGCEQHRFIPVLLERIATVADFDGDAVKYQTPSGASFTNGPSPGFSSFEMRDAPIEALTDPAVRAIKAAFPTAKVHA